MENEVEDEVGDEYTNTFIQKCLIGINPLGRMLYAVLHIIDGIVTILSLGLANSGLGHKCFMRGLVKSIEIDERRSEND